MKILKIVRNMMYIEPSEPLSVNNSRISVFFFFVQQHDMR